VVELYGLYYWLAIVGTQVKSHTVIELIFTKMAATMIILKICVVVIVYLIHFIVSKHNIVVFLVGFSLKYTCMTPPC